MKQSSDRLYIYPHLIIGANNLKKFDEQNLRKKIREIFFENVFMTISWKFAIIQAFTAP